MINHVGDVNIFQSFAVAILLYLSGLIYVLFVRTEGKSFLIGIFSLAFVLRALSIYAIYYYLISVGGDGFAIMDDRNYDRVAKDIVHELNKGLIGYKQYGTGWVNIAYFNLNGFLYHYLNFDTLSSRMLNGFLGALTAVFAYLIILRIYDLKRAKITGMMVALLPNLIFWSSLQLKDAPIIFCSTVLIYIMICKFRDGITLISLAVYFLFLYFLWHLRKDFCLPFIAVSILWLFMRYTVIGANFNKNKRKLGPAKIFIIFIAGIVLLTVVMSTQSGEQFVDSMSEFSEQQKNMAESGDSKIGFTKYLRIVSPSDIFKLPFAVAFTAIAPLPTFSLDVNPIMVGNALYTMINTALILILPYSVVGFFLLKSEKLNFTDELLLRWLPLATLIGISVIYMGVLRYKEMLMVYIVIWASMAISERKKYGKQILLIYIGSILSIFLALSVSIMFR